MKKLGNHIFSSNWSDGCEFLWIQFVQHAITKGTWVKQGFTVKLHFYSTEWYFVIVSYCPTNSSLKELPSSQIDVCKIRRRNKLFCTFKGCSFVFQHITWDSHCPPAMQKYIIVKVNLFFFCFRYMCLYVLGDVTSSECKINSQVL